MSNNINLQECVDEADVKAAPVVATISDSRSSTCSPELGVCVQPSSQHTVKDEQLPASSVLVNPVPVEHVSASCSPELGVTSSVENHFDAPPAMDMVSDF